MPRPPKGDPRRPLHLAIRSTRVLGALFVLLGLAVLAVPALYALRGGGSAGGGVILMGVASLLYLVPGVLYVLCAIYLRRRQLWAVIVALVLASVQLLFLAIGLLGVVIGIANSRGAATSFALVYLGLIGLVAAALAQLIYHLARSFEAIKHPPFGAEVRGFEPLPVAPLPLPPGAGGGTDAAPPGW